MDKRIVVEKLPLLIHLPQRYFEDLDMLVEKKLYADRNSAIRTAVRDLLRDEVWCKQTSRIMGWKFKTEVQKLINKLRDQQHDKSLTFWQRKEANELYKKLKMEEYPDVSEDLVNCALEIVMNTKKPKGW